MDDGNFAVLVSLTVQHGRRDALADTLDAVLEAFQAVTSGRAWVAERDACRIAGVIKGVEVTWSATHGWHPHIHAVILFDGCPDPVAYAKMIDRWMFTWQRAAQRHGFGASLERGVRSDTVTSGIGAREYLAKSSDGRGIGAEVACGDLKSGRLGSLTPAELLEYFHRTGDMAALELWQEYEQATHGRRRITWSRGLRQRLLAGVPELTDEEIAEAEVGGEVVADIPDETWDVMCREPGLMVAVLRAAETGGFQGVVDVLAPYGVTVRPPPKQRRKE